MGEAIGILLVASKYRWVQVGLYSSLMSDQWHKNCNNTKQIATITIGIQGNNTVNKNAGCILYDIVRD